MKIGIGQSKNRNLTLISPCKSLREWMNDDTIQYIYLFSQLGFSELIYKIIHYV